MSARLPPSGRTSRGSVTKTQTSAFSAPQEERGVGRSTSFTGESSGRLSEGRKTPTTGVRSVNKVMEQLNREIGSAPAGRQGLIVASAQADLEYMRENVSEKLKTARNKLENMKKKPKTQIKNMDKQEKIIKNHENRLRKYNNAVNKVLGKREQPNSKRTQPTLKRTKSTEEPPTITNKQRENAPKPTPVKPKPTNFLTSQTPTEKSNGASNQNTQRPIRRPVRRELFSGTRTSTNNSTGAPAQTNFQSKQNTSNNNENTRTPNRPIPKRNEPPSIKNQHREAKNQGARERAEERKKRWEEVPPAAKRSLEPIINQLANQKNTPPGITKTNLERLFQPFKQPVTVTVAPTISVKGGSAKQGIVMLESNATKKKKKTPPPKPQYLKTPGTIRREKEKARSIAVRKQIVASMRTPTKGQRKTHVIQLIDRVLRKMKAPKDTEKKLIKLYESLSEKQIKSLFGGRSPEFVKNTLKKQIGYLEKKKR